MKCTICKTGQTHPGITTVTLQRDNTVMVIRDFPTDICDDCGEYYLTKRLRAGCMPMRKRVRTAMLKFSGTRHDHQDWKNTMKCLHCRGEMKKGETPFHIDRKGCHVTLDSVPA